MKKIIIGLWCPILATLITINVWPQSGDSFQIEKSVISGGGGQVAGGGFTHDGTIYGTVDGFSLICVASLSAIKPENLEIQMYE